MSSAKQRTRAELRRKAARLPSSPGVYLMKNIKNEVIYVGKAKSLKNRVPQYFSSNASHGVKVQRMVENIDDFDYILTDSEFEALVLECSLIKQHYPKYNILLKDAKGYSYIRISRDGWPRITAELQRQDDGADYIGPFTSSSAVSNSVDEAAKIFRLPTCSKEFPRDFKKSRPCLNYFISQCSAPCAGKISEDDYRESVDEAIKFLRGGSAATVAEIQRQMSEASENLMFEKAAKLRDRLAAIKKINEKQKVFSASVREQDVFAVVSDGKKACLNVLRFFGGRLTESEFFIIDAPDSQDEARRELIRSYYAIRTRIPPRISADGGVEDRKLLEEWLSGVAGKRVSIVVPQRGEQARIVEMCRKNASEKLLQYSGKAGKSGKAAAALGELAEMLGISENLEYIEAYDISHTAGSNNVAGMVVFKDGVPFRRAYKRFSIKGFEGQDDYASMAEVIERRFGRYLEEKDTGEGFGKLPDLILVDGGHGQVNAVLPVLKSLGIKVPVFGMVKDNRHRTRAIAQSGGEIALTSKRQAFTLVSAIQEETHRFAVEYHRKRQKKSGLGTSLTTVKGIGEKRAKALLRHFKTVAAVKNASVDELCSAPGMTRPAAEAVYDYFHKEEKTRAD